MGQVGWCWAQQGLTPWCPEPCTRPEQMVHLWGMALAHGCILHGCRSDVCTFGIPCIPPPPSKSPALRFVLIFPLLTHADNKGEKL